MGGGGPSGPKGFPEPSRALSRSQWGKPRVRFVIMCWWWGSTLLSRVALESQHTSGNGNFSQRLTIKSLKKKPTPIMGSPRALGGLFPCGLSGDT